VQDEKAAAKKEEKAAEEARKGLKDGLNAIFGRS